MAVSAKELAKLIGVTERSIHRAEQSPKIGTKVKLAMELLQSRLAHGEIDIPSALGAAPRRGRPRKEESLGVREPTISYGSNWHGELRTGADLRRWRKQVDLYQPELAKLLGVAITSVVRADKLLSLDASVIDLCLSMYNWATFRQTKGAVKLHLLLDHDGYLPVFAHLTEGRVHEMIVAKSLNFSKGTVVVMDRGYVDYKLFARWTKAGIFFVTRLKENANYWDFEDRPLPKSSSNVLKDQLIRLNPITSGAPCKEDLRLVTVWDERNQCEVKLLTNQLQFAASTIADIYRERWQIELFFKALKQNLKIKTFVGTSANAVRIQIWTALIAVLLLKILQFKSTFGWALSNLVALLRWNLFSYRDLWEWINRPFDTPPESPAIQGELFDLDSILGGQT